MITEKGRGEETVGVSFYSMLKVKIKLNVRDDSNSILTVALYKCFSLKCLQDILVEEH